MARLTVADVAQDHAYTPGHRGYSVCLDYREHCVYCVYSRQGYGSQGEEA